MSSHQFVHAQQRRSTRIEKAMPIVVQGVGALREPYQEQVSTLSISCHGCTYQTRHEVIQGETVFLDIKTPNNASVGYSSRAQVKWVQKIGAKDRAFQVAVELESAGNVWGIASPPGDWFPAKMPEGIESAASLRELRVVTRKEQQTVPAPSGGPDQNSPSERIDTAVASIPPITQVMVGLGEQIQRMASEAAAAALSKEKSRLLEEFRGQIRSEAVKTIQSAIAASKGVIARQALKDLSEAQETGARNNYSLWMKKIENDMESARQHMLIQVKEVTRHIDGIAGSTIEHVKRNMETSRGEAADRFVSRLRDQVAPMLAEAKDSMQRLEARKTAFKKESETIYAGLENQLEYSADTSVAKAQEELEKSTAAIAARTNEALLNLYQGLEKAARENVNLLLSSIGNQMTGILQERAAEVSREFSTGVESYTRSYLESVGKSIAEIPQNMPGRSGH